MTLDKLFLMIDIATGIIIFVGAVYTLYRILSPKYRTKSSDDPLKFFRFDEITGIILGKNTKKKLAAIPYGKEAHIAVFGGSGTGKTTAIIIPTLQSWGKSSGTALVIDIAGDISENVQMPNQLIFDPDSDAVPYNVFGMIDDMPDDEKDEALFNLAILLLPSIHNSSANAQYYQNGGQRILAGSFIAFYHMGLDFVSICQQIIVSDYRSLFSAIDKTGNRVAINYINGFSGSSESNVAGCKDRADDAVRIFTTNQHIIKSFHRPQNGETCITPDALESHSIFLRIADYKLNVYSPALRIIVDQSLNYFGSRKNYTSQRVLFVLDEFASLGRIDMINALRKFRKKGVNILIATQSLADLYLIYGHDETHGMLNNFSYKVVLSASDADTQAYFSRLVGREERDVVSYTSDATFGTGKQKTVRKELRNIIEPEEFANLGNDLVVLYPGGSIRLEKNYFFEK